MHHYALPQYFCPVKSLTDRMHHLYAITPEDASLPISSIENTKNITATNITLLVCESVFLSGLLNSGYFPLRVSAHSLKSIVSVSLRPNDLEEDTINKLG